jgi:glycosyltransferase involved in cell wall biosynthesis
MPILYAPNMKVIMVTPQYHQPRGNTVTVKRISEGLHHIGIMTDIVSLTKEEPFPELPAGDLVHGFNAHYFSEYWSQRGSKSLPYMVTLTGTDLNQYLFNEQTKAPIIRTLHDAKGVHVFNTKARDILWREVHGLQYKTFLIPQGIRNFPFDQSNHEKEAGSFLFVLPAGIRKVKNIISAISMLKSLYEENPKIRLWLVGPIIEEMEGRKVIELIEQNAKWIRYLGQLSHPEMGGIYRSADVVLNTSLSEGQSSAILEAMSMGIPVLGSGIAGNRDVVTHAETGYLYGSEDEFSQYAHRLIQNEALRNEIGALGKAYVKKYHSVEKEIQEIAGIYKAILQHK